MTFYNLPETDVKIECAVKADPEDKRLRKLVISQLPEDGYTVVEEGRPWQPQLVPQPVHQ